MLADRPLAVDCIRRTVEIAKRDAPRMVTTARARCVVFTQADTHHGRLYGGCVVQRRVARAAVAPS